MLAFARAEAGRLHGAAAPLLRTRTAILIGALLCLVALTTFALGRYTDVDLYMGDALYDRAAGAFPWRNAWLTDLFGHHILKMVLTVLAALTIAAAIGDMLWPQVLGKHFEGRLRLRVIAWSAVLVPSVISLLKQNSNAHCPWDLARYGGSAPYVRLFEAMPIDAIPGHCLPADHASSALWLVSLAVLWLPGQERRAWRLAGGALALGLAVGWMQQMRGAHFLTHTLWSVCIACGIVLTLVVVLQSLTRCGPGQ